AWCKREGLRPADDEANYRYLVVELRTTERKAIAKVTAAKTLADKVKAFELAFERAGVKHYDKRNRWAAIALDALSLPEWAVDWNERAEVDPSLPPAPGPVPDKPKREKVSTSKRFWTWLTTAGVAIVTAIKELGLVDLDWRVQIAILLVIVGFAVYAIAAMPAVRRALGLVR
ncbi:phage tail tip lysozyme, partial [Rhizobiaceae sp. 2RAB30]